MPVEFVGGLFPRNQLAGPGGGRAQLDLEYLRDLARAHEHADFDRVLIANGNDPLHLAAYAAAHTEKLGFMIAHRPFLTAPTVAARAFATLDHTTGGGRIRLHAITGITAEPQNGDYLVDKDERYRRTDEYLEIVRRTWTSEEPFDFEGKYFQVKGAFSPIKPLQQPHIPISFGGSSDIAYHIAVKHADLYAFWGEPLADAKEQIAKLRAAAEAAGVAAPRISLSVRLIVGATEELAWQKAHDIVSALQKNYKPLSSHGIKGVGAQRLLAAAERGERHDRALWMPTASAVGGSHDSTSLVGTPETVVAALLDYYDIGVTTFLSRGYDPLYDAVDYGRWIIPAVRAEVRGRELQAEQASKVVTG